MRTCDWCGEQNAGVKEIEAGLFLCSKDVRDYMVDLIEDAEVEDKKRSEGVVEDLVEYVCWKCDEKWWEDIIFAPENPKCQKCGEGNPSQEMIVLINGERGL